MEARYRAIIADEFRNCVLNTIRRLDNAETNRPFHAALLSDEALFWSRFERSFSTSFGQRVIEEISKVVALAGVSSNVIAKLGKNDHVSMETLAKICTALNCDLADIVEMTGDTGKEDCE